MNTNKALLSYQKLLSLSTSERFRAGKFCKQLQVSDKDRSVAELFISQICTLYEDMKSSSSKAIYNGYLSLEHVGSSSRLIHAVISTFGIACIQVPTIFLVSYFPWVAFPRKIKQTVDGCKRVSFKRDLMPSIRNN